MTRLRLGQSGVRIQSVANFNLLKTSGRFWGPPRCLFNVFLPGCTEVWQWTWPLTSSGEDKLDWRCTFSAYVVWTTTIVTCSFFLSFFLFIFLLEIGRVMIFWANLAQERDRWRAVANMMGNYPTLWTSVVFWRPCWKEAGLLHQLFNLTMCNCDLCKGACGWGDNVSNSLYLEIPLSSAQKKKIAGLVQKPNVPCHVHKSVSLTGLCLFEKERSHARYEWPVG